LPSTDCGRNYRSEWGRIEALSLPSRPYPPVRMSSDDSTPAFSPHDEALLLRLAVQSIERRLSNGGGSAARELEPPVPLHEWSPPLHVERATFVTLHREQALRGCCGSIRAFEPLGRNVVRSAITAAFSDRRFPPVAADELADLDLHISILNPAEPLAFLTEADLVAQLRPHVDGVILVESELRAQGVFLPSVWKQLEDPRDFVRRLKVKAGLPPEYWSPWLAASRFTVHSVEGRAADWLSTVSAAAVVPPRGDTPHRE
jgi:AmmeMemoRadiSam system protein A